MYRCKGAKGSSPATDPFIKIQRSRDQLLSWTKINHIKQDLNNEILSVCIPPTLKVFGSNADLLQYLTTYSSKPQLDAMYQIIHQTIQKFRVADKKVLLTNASRHLPENSTTCRYFSKISDESVVNICSFLLRKEILIFKSVSRQIAILCLKEMNKYSVGICLAQKLLDLKHTDALTWNDKMTFNRYHTATTYSPIFEQQETANNAVEKYQIAIIIDKIGEYNKCTRSDLIYPKSSLIIFDKRDLAILDSMHEASRPMAVNDVFLYDTHFVLALYYFDVYNQEVSLIKCVLITNSITTDTLEKYIKNKLLNMASKQYTMDGTVTIYSIHGDRITSNTIIANSNDSFLCAVFKKNDKIISLIFQIESKFLESGNLGNREFEYEVSQLRTFRYKYSCSSTKRVTLKWRSNELSQLKQQIKGYILATKQSEELCESIIQQIDTKFAIANKFEFMFDSSLDLDILRHYFSRFMFKNVIPANWIEIFVNAPNGELRVCKRVHPIHSQISLRLVAYNTVGYNYMYDHDHRILHVSVYCEQQAPFPFNTTNKPGEPIKISIKMPMNQCTVAQIMETLIKISKQPLFSHQFEQIKGSFDNYTNATNPNCYATIDDYKYAANKNDEDYGSRKFKEYNVLYQSQSTERIKDQNSKYEKVTKLNIFMIPNEEHNIMTAEKHKLMIRFIWIDHLRDMIPSERIHDLFIGFPLFIWCNKEDSLQDVLSNNQILQKYKDGICGTYQITDQYVTITRIAETERNTFRIYQDLLLGDDDGFIVIVLSEYNVAVNYRVVLSNVFFPMVQAYKGLTLGPGFLI